MHWLSDELSELLEDFDILDETHLKKLSGLLILCLKVRSSILC